MLSPGRANAQVTMHKVIQLVRVIDRDGDGKIDFNEFWHFMRHREDSLSSVGLPLELKLGCINCNCMFVSSDTGKRMCPRCSRQHAGSGGGGGPGHKTECRTCRSVFTTGINGEQPVRDCPDCREAPDQRGRRMKDHDAHSAILDGLRAAFRHFDPAAECLKGTLTHSVSERGVLIGQVESLLSRVTTVLSQEEVDLIRSQFTQPDQPITFENCLLLLLSRPHVPIRVWAQSCSCCQQQFTTSDGSSKTCFSCTRKNGSQTRACQLCNAVFVVRGDKSKDTRPSAAAASDAVVPMKCVTCQEWVKQRSNTWAAFKQAERR